MNNGFLVKSQNHYALTVAHIPGADNVINADGVAVSDWLYELFIKGRKS